MTYPPPPMKRTLLPIGLRFLHAALGAVCLALPAASARGVCVGDCDGSGSVTISDLIIGVNIALGTESITACEAFNCDGTGMVPIHCLIQGVNNALYGCGTGTTCPLGPGMYTLTGVSGGNLRVSTLAPIPFPPGATVVADVGLGDPSCVHNLVVPFPGGFHSPTLCITSLGFSVSLAQTGCGIGEIASKGGADFTVEEIGDTSDHSSVCNLPQVCTAGQDSAVRIQVTVGDGTPDTCKSGTANAILSIPEHTVVWVDASGTCPATDGMYDPDKGDTLIVEFDQILDLTTDTNSTKWMDLDGDGCSLAGAGPAAGYSNTGTCADLTNDTVALAASGTIGSKGAPLFDITYSALLPFTFSGPDAPLESTCDSPPVIDFNGTANQCISTR